MLTEARVGGIGGGNMGGGRLDPGRSLVVAAPHSCSDRPYGFPPSRE